jgi:hypothetical protein
VSDQVHDTPPDVVPTPKMLGTPEFFANQMDTMAWLAAEALHQHQENQRAWYAAVEEHERQQGTP